MTLGAMDAAARETFDRLCGAVGRRGRGLTLRDLAAARALAVEVTGGDPDPSKVREFARRLDLDPEALP